MLYVRVLATPGNYSFNCLLDAELTSEGYDDKLESAFYEDVKKFEALHPEITLNDLIDHNKRVPEDTLIGVGSNQIKDKNNLVTTGQTWA